MWLTKGSKYAATTARDIFNRSFGVITSPKVNKSVSLIKGRHDAWSGVDNTRVVVGRAFLREGAASP